MDFWVISDQTDWSPHLSFHNQCILGGHSAHVRLWIPCYIDWLYLLSTLLSPVVIRPTLLQLRAWDIENLTLHLLQFWSGLEALFHNGGIERPTNSVPRDLSKWLCVSVLWSRRRCSYPVASSATQWVGGIREIQLIHAWRWVISSTRYCPVAPNNQFMAALTKIYVPWVDNSRQLPRTNCYVQLYVEDIVRSGRSRSTCLKGNLVIFHPGMYSVSQLKNPRRNFFIWNPWKYYTPPPPLFWAVQYSN